MVEHRHDAEAKGTWVTYRPEIKVLDCTIRDGGLINNHKWTDDFVRAVYETLVEAGVDFMEVGYKGSKEIYPPDEHGPWKHCDEETIRRAIGDNPSDMKISVMADAERSDYRKDVIPKEQSVIDIIRVACYIHQVPTAVDMVHDAKEKGYEVALQLMAVSVVQDRELADALQVIRELPISVLYLVDSFGALYSEQIRDYVHIYQETLEGTGIEVGMHAHNNQQLAYANTIEACIVGANRLDATINGMGRGAGNCPLELLLGFLKNPKFNLRPVIKCITDHCVPMQDHMEWGYRLPYAVTGQLNQHPRDAIKMRASDRPDDYLAFYDEMIDKE